MLAIEDTLSSLVRKPKDKIIWLKTLKNYFKILENEPLEGIEKLYKHSHIRELVKFTLVFERLYVCMLSEIALSKKKVKKQ